MRKISLMTICATYLNIALSQNIVKNSQSIGNSTCEFVTLDTVPIQWSRQTSGITPVKGLKNASKYNSPDFFSGKCLDTNKVIRLSRQNFIKLPYREGMEDGFVGMYSSYSEDYKEGVMYELSNKMKPGFYYRLTFYMAIADSDKVTTTGGYYDNKIYNHQLKIKFSRYSENWKSNKAYELVEDIVPSPEIKIGSILKWYRFSYSFRLPETRDGQAPKDLANIIFINELTPGAKVSYVFLDDVNLTEINACKLSCLDSNLVKNVEVPSKYDNYYIPTSNIHPQTLSPISWRLPISNATEINLKIYDRWGGKVYEQQYYDPNGLDLRQSGAPYFPLEWGGTDIDKNILPAGSYVFLLLVKNCFDKKTYSFQVDWHQITPSYHIPDYLTWQVDTIKKCCIEQLTINSVKYMKDTFVRVDKRITAGNLDSVIVTAGKKVNYYAGEKISLGKYFHVKKGGVFSVDLKFCSLADFGQSIQPINMDNWALFRNNDKLLKTDSTIVAVNDNLNIITPKPNPFTNSLELYSNKINDYVIYDNALRSIKTGKLNLGYNVIKDLEFLPNGTYIIKYGEQEYYLVKYN